MAERFPHKTVFDQVLDRLQGTAFNESDMAVFVAAYAEHGENVEKIVASVLFERYRLWGTAESEAWHHARSPSELRGDGQLRFNAILRRLAAACGAKHVDVDLYYGLVVLALAPSFAVASESPHVTGDELLRHLLHWGNDKARLKAVTRAVWALSPSAGGIRAAQEWFDAFDSGTLDSRIDGEIAQLAALQAAEKRRSRLMK